MPGGTIDVGPVGTVLFLGAAASVFFAAAVGTVGAGSTAAAGGAAGTAGPIATVCPEDRSFDSALLSDFFLNIVGERWERATAEGLRADEELLAGAVPGRGRSCLFRRRLILLLLLLVLLQQMKKSGRKRAVVVVLSLSSATAAAAASEPGRAETAVSAEEGVVAAGAGRAVRTSIGFNVVPSACCGW